jgi:hypothetical protein
MPTLVLYRYRAFDPVRRRWYVTHAMTEQEAGRLGNPTPLEWSREERRIDTDPLCLSTSAFLKGSATPDP